MVSPGYSRPYASAFSIRYCAIRALIDPDGLRNSNFTHTPSTRISGVSPMLSRMVACHGSTGRTVDPVELSRIVMANSELEASSNRTPARVRRPSGEWRPIDTGRLSVPVVYLTVPLPKVPAYALLVAAERDRACSAASRGVQLVLLPLVDGVAAVASA